MPTKYYEIEDQWQEIGTAPIAIQVKRGRLRIHAGDAVPEAESKDYVLASDERDGYPRSPKFTKPEKIYMRSDLSAYTVEVVVVS